MIFSLSAAGPAWAQPDGSYLRTCRDVRAAGKYRPDALLTAECQTRKVYWRESSLYYKRCRDAFLDARTLHAECRTFNGRWTDARLNINACPWGPVANDNGRLVCGGGPGAARAAAISPP